ncbi:MAG: SAM-dependent methyltransferase, partial [Micrococcales bacterium]|nr:SAM-dependent methyltransferase [Micrococcales bacterium]
MTPEALAAVLSPQGWALLNALPPYDERQALRVSQRLHDEGLDPALVAAVLTQSRLRAKAREKFANFADGMLFTAVGLEQATRLTVAAHHAHRFREAGLTCVADLTCGIGADAMAFAGVGLAVRAAETDEVTAAVATVNLRHFPEATVTHNDGLVLDLAGVDGVWADPARRRRSGSRVFDPAAFSPPLDQVLALREKVRALGIKLGPGLAHSAVPSDARAQWV